MPPNLVRSIEAKLHGAGKRVLGDGWPLVRPEVLRLGRLYAGSLIEIAAAGDHPKRRRAKVFWHLNSFAAKLVNILLAAAHKRVVLSWEDAQEHARRLSARVDCGETFRVFGQDKANGGVRYLCSFGLLRTALQRLGLDLAKALVKLPATEFAAEGAGRNAAVSLLVDRMNSTGRKHLVLGDLQNCFGSIKPEHVTEVLPLPIGVIETLYFSNGGPVETDIGIDTDIEAEILSGLLQGSPSSSYIAALVVGRFTHELPGLVPGLSFADDIAAPCDATEGQAIKEALLQRANASPAGKFAFKHLAVVEVTSAAEPTFLGYKFCRSAAGTIRVKPTPASIYALLARLQCRIMAIKVSEVYEFAAAKVDEWIATQAAWMPDENQASMIYVQAHEVAQAELAARGYLNGQKKAA